MPDKEMNANKANIYFQKYANEIVQIDAFSVDKMGLIQAQTMLKIDELQVVCSPFQLSMQRAVLLCVLSERELPFFLHYKEKLSALKLSFNASLFSHVPIKLMVWTKINQMIPLKGRQDLCMVDLSFKQCPEDLIIILGGYLDIYKQYLNLYVRYRDKAVIINTDNSMRLKFNNYAEAAINAKKVKVQMLSIAANRFLLEIPAVDPDIQPGFEFEIKLYFQKYRFSVKVVVEEVSPVSDDLLKLNCAVKFSSELVDVMNDYFIQIS